MLKQFIRRLFSVSEHEAVNDNIYQQVIDKVGVDNELNKFDFIPAKARSISIETSSSCLLDLQGFLIEATVVVLAREYLPPRWKVGRTQIIRQSLDFYISDGNEIIHPFDWVETHRHYIIKLTDAVLTMDDAEREYYLRYINFIIEDILALLAASKECVR